MILKKESESKNSISEDFRTLTSLYPEYFFSVGPIVGYWHILIIVLNPEQLLFKTSHVEKVKEIPDTY